MKELYLLILCEFLLVLMVVVFLIIMFRIMFELERKGAFYMISNGMGLDVFIIGVIIGFCCIVGIINTIIISIIYETVTSFIPFIAGVVVTCVLIVGIAHIDPYSELGKSIFCLKELGEQ